MGQFGCYFRGYYIDEEPGGGSQHGASLIEFQRTTKTVWQKILRFYAEEDGCTMIRMFPRGDSGGSAWEGLDIGGRVNLPLLTRIRADRPLWAQNVFAVIWVTSGLLVVWMYYSTCWCGI